MGLVIRFPLEQRIAQDPGSLVRGTEPAPVVILPVIRIDRHSDGPSGGVAPGSGTGPGRGRRRPASRP
jgi:hypothetical protein